LCRFTLGVDELSGGFAGVDIFFVISGFLITRIIARQVEDQNFSFLRFYEKRARRILPALTVVIVATAAAGVALALPQQLRFIGESILATAAFSTNILLWRSSGYFAPSTELTPLLHIWSLSVEEQFYLLFPFVLVASGRLHLNSRRVLAVGTPLLFALGLFLSITKASVAFYLLPARAWELAVGGALALGVLPPVAGRWRREAMSLVGFAALIWGLFLITPHDTWPGYLALLPCVGTALVIGSHGETPTVVARLLATRPVVGMGLISYSLYLWHWPVLVLLRMHLAEVDLPIGVATAGVVFSVVMAYLTWLLVEQPFRDVQRISSRQVGIFSMACMLGLLAVGATLVVGKGFPERLSEQTQEALAAAEDVDPYRWSCPEREPENFHQWEEACAFGGDHPTLDHATYVVWGDSHAAALRPAIERALEDQIGALWWRGGCIPLLGTTLVPDPDAAQCAESREMFLRHLEAYPNITTVVIAGRWLPAATGISAEVGGSFRTYLSDDQTSGLTDASRLPAFRRGLARSITAFRAAGKRVVLFGGVPEAGYDVPTILALASHNGAMHPAAPARAQVAADYRAIDECLRSLTSGEEVTFIPIWPSLCEPECTLSTNGIALFSDDDHLTATAARDVLGPRLVQLFREHRAP
jgi:peptidoglycan/LPS O-acetylase OafA/YrhL